MKDLQSTSDQKAEVAKLAIEIEYSKRNEEIVNKKYDKVIEDLRKIDEENKKLSEESMEKELDFVNTHIFMKEKYNLQQRTIDELSAKIFPYRFRQQNLIIHRQGSRDLQLQVPTRKLKPGLKRQELQPRLEKRLHLKLKTPHRRTLKKTQKAVHR